MKLFTIKWAKRLWALLAIKLFIIATCLTLVRILFISIEDHKEDVTDWLSNEYNINFSVEHVSAGIDFSGLVLTLNNTHLTDSENLPFSLSTEHLFLHLDFWKTITQKRLNFNKITSKGVVLSFNDRQQDEQISQESTPTIEALLNVYLHQFQQFSVTDARINFTNQLGTNESIYIQKLQWRNKDNEHQGIGTASFTEEPLGKALQFVVDLSSITNGNKNTYKGQLYAEADNLDMRDYLNLHVNKNIPLTDASISFQLWADFSLDKLKQIQIQLNESHLAWLHGETPHDWEINGGTLQLSNKEKFWLLDSYDVDIAYNQHKLEGLAFAGVGSANKANFNFSELNLKNILPFYLLTSNLSDSEITKAQEFAINGEVQGVEFNRNTNNEITFNLFLNAFKNKPVDAIPGISHADIVLNGNRGNGSISVVLNAQDIYFDGQFNRSMPIESAQLDLNWQITDEGMKFYSEQSIIKTTELDTMTEFSLLIPHENAANKDTFLSLYTYASLNDASKAQHYFPIKALGEDVYGYLQPTIQKGRVEGAKILWYGSLNNYPYHNHNGIFQAWVPLRDAQYDFYGDWQGLTDLDLNLLFENDWLIMDALKASLGDVRLEKLSARIDQLSEDGVLTIDADIKDDAQKVSDYLKSSPLQDSVGSALHILELEKLLSGNLKLAIPFSADQETRTIGEITLNENNLNVRLSDDISLPLTHVNGDFSFINGNLTAKSLSAKLFSQPVQFSFITTDELDKYQVDVDLSGKWNSAQLTDSFPLLAEMNLSGPLQWSGNVDFTYLYDTDKYKYGVNLNTAAQGLGIDLPAPFNKNSLQNWPVNIAVSGDSEHSKFTVNIDEKLDLAGKLNYYKEPLVIEYVALNIGTEKLANIQPDTHRIDLTLNKLDITPWYNKWSEFSHETSPSTGSAPPLIDINTINIDIKEALFFEQAINNLVIHSVQEKKKWIVDFDADNLQGNVEYRSGIPDRIDIDIKKVEFQDLSYINQDDNSKAMPLLKSDNLLLDYPEVFVKCDICLIGDINFSPLKAHIFPTKSRLNIDHIKVGTETEYTSISGVWDQKRTNIIFDSLADENQSIEKRLGFVSPIVFQKAELTGAVNWMGAPWDFNFESLNGSFSTELTNGSITEVSDKGARLLSVFSLDGIRRSLNFEFNNVFAKGFNFNDFSLSANITNGVLKNDDFYLEGSAGKIIGKGTIDLPNQETNFKFSYSPAVTSSLPVLTAFAINPITGAAVLLMSKLFEPVVDTIIRVDYSVKGPLSDPEVTLINSQKGKVELQNSEVLDEINEESLNNERGQQ